jgi:hypothetical protein
MNATASPTESSVKQELRRQLHAERIEIGREQYRQAHRLDEIRALLHDLDEAPSDG